MDSIYNKVFIKDLPRKTNLALLKGFLLRFVDIVSFTKQKNHAKDELLAVTVEVANPDQANTLIQGEFEFEGSKILISKFLSQEERLQQSLEIKQKRIFVNDLSIRVTEKEILNFFLNFGQIHAVFLKKKFSDLSCTLGITYCFITFKDKESKDKVLDAKKFLHEQFGMNIVQSIEESKILNRIKYNELVELTNRQGVSVTHNYFEKNKKFDQQMAKNMKVQFAGSNNNESTAQNQKRDKKISNLNAKFRNQEKKSHLNASRQKLGATNDCSHTQNIPMWNLPMEIQVNSFPNDSPPLRTHQASFLFSKNELPINQNSSKFSNSIKEILKISSILKHERDCNQQNPFQNIRFNYGTPLKSKKLF